MPEVEVPGGEIGLVVGEPAQFRFFSSGVRQTDKPGELLASWRDDELTETDSLSAVLPPVVGVSAFEGVSVAVSLLSFLVAMVVWTWALVLAAARTTRGDDVQVASLFLVQGDGTALRYGIGVGKPGFTWAGVKNITAKKEWPDWTPPPEMLQRRPDLPSWMAGGPENPLGARAMYLGSTLYRIHGSNEPWTIGTAVSSGCIRMRNEDVIDLYGRVNVGTKVVVM